MKIINNVKDLAKDISVTYGIDKKKATEIVEEVFNSMKDIMLADGELGIKNFGSFKVRRQGKMRYYDFRDKQVKQIDRKVLVFYPSVKLKELVNQDGVPTAGQSDEPQSEPAEAIAQ